MTDKTVPNPCAWGFRAGSALTLLLAVMSVAFGVCMGISSQIWFGLAFAVAAVAQFLTSFVTRERLFVCIIAQVVLAAVMGFLFGVGVVMSL